MKKILVASLFSIVATSSIAQVTSSDIPGSHAFVCKNLTTIYEKAAQSKYYNDMSVDGNLKKAALQRMKNTAAEVCSPDYAGVDESGLINKDIFYSRADGDLRFTGNYAYGHRTYVFGQLPAYYFYDGIRVGEYILAGTHDKGIIYDVDQMCYFYEASSSSLRQIKCRR